MEDQRRGTEELEQLEYHAVRVVEILAAIARLRAAILSARPHHARSDSTYYPDGPTGENMPLELQTLGIADCFDVMVTHASNDKATLCPMAWSRARRARDVAGKPSLTLLT